MQQISRRFYLVSFLTGSLASLALFFLAGLFAGIEIPPFAITSLVLGVGAAIYVITVWLIFTYKIWSHLPSEHARTTPGKALGFLFIPFFNLYWLFQAYWGWTKDYNAMVDRQASGLRRMPEGLALAMCIVDIVNMVLGWTPLVFLIQPAVIVLTSMFISRACRGINALAALPPERLRQAGQEPAPAVKHGEFSTAPRMSATEGTPGIVVAGFILAILGLGLSFLTAVPGLILGIVGLNKINNSAGRLRGGGLAISAIVISGFALLVMPLFAAIMVPAFARARSEERAAQAMNNLRQISVAMTMYELEFGRLPPVDDWVNLTSDYLSDPDAILSWAGDPEAGRMWAMNVHLEDVRRTQPSPVLLFEARPGSPPSGGPELLPESPRGPGGYLVLFLDGRVDRVVAEEIHRLNWEP